jgi:exodeoxyribonuclease VII small subunit
MKTRKKIAAQVPPKDGLSFEQAIARLEKIVADMEGAELPLEDVLKKYEEGSRLVRFCSQKLEEAEKKIELLTKKADGRVELKPFEEAEPAKEETGDEEEEDKEGKLF